MEDLIEQEKVELEIHRHQVLEEEIQEKREKRKQKEALLDDLVLYGPNLLEYSVLEF